MNHPMRRWMTLCEVSGKLALDDGGVRLIGHGSYKNTLVFDPKDVHPIAV